MKIRIAQLQTMVFPNKKDTLDYVSKLIHEGAGNGADIVCLPEMFCCPYETKNFPIYAEGEGGETYARLSEMAAGEHVILSAGSMPERAYDEDGSEHIYNTAYVFGREGQLLGKHRKAHLFDIDVKGGQRFMESETLTRGEKITVFDTEYGKLGLCICFDIRFPELVRMMALEGAELILVPAAFNMTTGPLHWDLCFRSQAMYSQVFVVGTSPARDMDFSYHAYGHSLVCDPWGRVLSEADEKEGITYTDIDLADVKSLREQLPLIGARRTDLYELRKM